MAAVFAEVEADGLGFGLPGELGNNDLPEFQVGGNFPIVGSEFPGFGVFLLSVHDKDSAFLS